MPSLATNKAAYSAYHIHETWEAGLKLKGPEVKAAKLGHVQLKGSYLTIEHGELIVVGMHISAYRPAVNAQRGYHPAMPRRLLLKKKEISHMIGNLKAKGLTMIPLKLYTKGGLVKIEIGLVSSKSKHDQRLTIRKRELDREIRSRLRGK